MVTTQLELMLAASRAHKLDIGKVNNLVNQQRSHLVARWSKDKDSKLYCYWVVETD
jgi:hypothetical protein